MAPLTPADGPLGRLECVAELLSLSLLLLATCEPVVTGAEASEVAVMGGAAAVVKR